MIRAPDCSLSFEFDVTADVHHDVSCDVSFHASGEVHNDSSKEHNIKKWKTSGKHLALLVSDKTRIRKEPDVTTLSD